VKLDENQPLNEIIGIENPEENSLLKVLQKQEVER
jgi:hypothetical protein